MSPRAAQMVVALGVVTAVGLLVSLTWDEGGGLEAATPQQQHQDTVTVLSAMEGVIQQQNETITALHGMLKRAGDRMREMDAARAELEGALEAAGRAQPQAAPAAAELAELAELAKLRAEVDALRKAEAAEAVTADPGGSGAVADVALPASALRSDCDRRFGKGMLQRFADSETELCEPLREGGARLRCWSIQQDHQRAKGTYSTFCEATNMVLDFSRVGGSTAARKQGNGATHYHSFGAGALSGDCRKTAAMASYEKRLMNHMRSLVRSLETTDEAPPSSETEATPTLLIQRDEDAENTFHATADHLNLFTVSHLRGLEAPTTRALLFDTHPDYGYTELIHLGFASAAPLARAGDFGGRRVRFRRLVLHMESPGSIVSPFVLDPMVCRDSVVWKGFVARVLQGFGLYDVAPPSQPSVTMVVRRRTAQKNVGRVLENEEELTSILREGNAMDARVVDLAALSFREQVTIMRGTNVLVGVHGAGLMHIMFTAEEAVLLEIHPRYRMDRHFRLAARQSGKIYLPMRATDAVKCHGSSDAVYVRPEHFRSALDAAVRVARSLHDGLSECGLTCDPRILKMDKFVAQRPYKAELEKVAPYEKRFPCG